MNGEVKEIFDAYFAKPISPGAFADHDAQYTPLYRGLGVIIATRHHPGHRLVIPRRDVSDQRPECLKNKAK